MSYMSAGIGESVICGPLDVCGGHVQSPKNAFEASLRSAECGIVLQGVLIRDQDLIPERGTEITFGA